MRAYLSNLPMRTWLLGGVSAIVLAYPVVRILFPAVVRAMVPEAVRTILSAF